MSAKSVPRGFTVADIEAAFTLWGLPEMQSGPVGRRRFSGGYFIRVLVGVSTKGPDTTEKFDYFYVDDDGTIRQAPRGHAKDYRPGRITDMDRLRAMAGEESS